MNLDDFRIRRSAQADPRLAPLAESLAGGDYASALQLTRTPDYPDDLTAVELKCLALFANGRLVEASATAEELVARAIAAGDRSAGPARRLLAERLWNIDLRRNYMRVAELLAPEDDPGDHDDVERFRRRILLADYAQCRGFYDLAGRCLDESAFLATAVADATERTACMVEYELANCRSLQGRHQFQNSLESAERGLVGARELGNHAAEVRLLIRRARTQMMLDDHAAAIAAYQDAAVLYADCERTGITCWQELESEVAFAQGAFALFQRRPMAAERHLRAVSEIASRIGSHEGYVEAAVYLTAAVLMQERPEAAIRQYQEARKLCKDDCYADLSTDLDGFALSKRFATAIASSHTSGTSHP